MLHHYIHGVKVIVMTSLVVSLVGKVEAVCNLKPPKFAGETRASNGSVALECLQSIPFNETWAKATIDTLLATTENFAFLDLYMNSGPPYSVGGMVSNCFLLRTTNDFLCNFCIHFIVQV